MSILKKLSSLLLMLILLGGCASHINKSAVQLPAAKQYAIGSFWNYTETPMAGLSAASIVEGVLAKKSITLYSMVEGTEANSAEITKTQQLNQQIQIAQSKKLNYLITGEVQEWRYKTGIDAEPVVSFTLKVIDLQTNQVVFSGLGAKSGLGHQSIGTVAQEIAEALIPQFVP